jgi:hypothetical protein
MAAVGADRQIRTDRQLTILGFRGDARHSSFLLHEAIHFGGHFEPEARVALGSLGQKIQKVPLRHESHELRVHRQMREIDQRNRHVADFAFE